MSQRAPATVWERIPDALLERVFAWWVKQGEKVKR
jgi:hypothetical protein